MTLAELTHNQQLALAALIESVAMASGRVTEGEAKRIDGIVAELGERVYRDLLEEAEQTFGDEEELREALSDVTDQDARELIYGTVLDEAMAEPTAQAVTSEWLGWLRREWHIRVDVDDEDEGSASGA